MCLMKKMNNKMNSEVYRLVINAKEKKIRQERR